jgi:hypothetical protein
MTTIEELAAWYAATYETKLSETLSTYAADGELDDHVDGTWIDAETLGATDEDAWNAFRDHLTVTGDADLINDFRANGTEAAEAMNAAVQAIDFAGLIKAAREASSTHEGQEEEARQDAEFRAAQASDAAVDARDAEWLAGMGT